MPDSPEFLLSSFFATLDFCHLFLKRGVYFTSCNARQRKVLFHLRRLCACVCRKGGESEGGGEGCCTNSLYYNSVVRTTVNVVFVLVFAFAFVFCCCLLLCFFSFFHIHIYIDGRMEIPQRFLGGLQGIHKIYMARRLFFSRLVTNFGARRSVERNHRGKKKKGI